MIHTRQSTAPCRMAESAYWVTEYESGWWVETDDVDAPIESCRFVQCAGPYKTERSAQRCADRMNSEVARNAH